MRGKLIVTVVAIAASAICQSQTPDAPTFDVVSLKPSAASTRRESAGGPESRDPGRYFFHRAALQDLIAIAYDTKFFQISSKAPLDGKRFDLDAKLPADTTAEQFRAMMRTMLSERFHLTAHQASKEFPGFELSVAKTGAKLRQAEAGDPPQQARPNSQGDGFPDLTPHKPGMASSQTTNGHCAVTQLRAQEQTIAALAGWLQSLVEDPIRDATGLTGKYDFTLEYAREVPNAGAPSPDPSPGCAVPELFSALQQQLGINLIRRRLQFEILVIDSFDPVPAEN